MSDKPNSNLKLSTNLRDNSTVRRRAIKYILALRELGYEQLPLEQATDFFSEQTGLYDQKTLKAYFGTQAHESIRKMQRVARYPSGTVSFKALELSQQVKTTKGYLERMGLVSYELRGQIWFMMILKDAVLVPQLYERCVSMRNISLSPIDNLSCGERARENRAGGCLANSEIEKKQTNNNLQDEREKLYNSVIFISDAKPCEEPDRAKVKWPKSDLE